MILSRSANLSERSARGAANVLAAIYLSIEFIRQNPEVSEKTSIARVRAKTVMKYRFKIFYRIAASDDTIEIVHVRHTSRRPWRDEDAREGYEQSLLAAILLTR